MQLITAYLLLSDNQVISINIKIKILFYNKNTLIIKHSEIEFQEIQF